MPRPALWLLLAVSLAAARPAAAQAAVEWTDAPLADVLYELADRTGLDLVFAVRVVRDRRVTARYTPGEDAARALGRILAGTGVRAEPIRPGQYVLIAEPLNVTLGDDTEPEAYTGTLEGRVVDAETGEGLPGASVYLVAVGLGGVADPDGAFAVPGLPAGRYTVRVTYVGYRPVRLDLDVFPVSPRLPFVVRLMPEPVASFDAEVKAGASWAGPVPGVTDVAARGVSTVSSPLGRGDLGAALAALPGLTRAGGASGRLVVRGADPDALRVLRDGVPVYEPWHAGGLVPTLQPEGLGRILLHRGQFPATIGGGLAAVLETETTSALAGDTSGVVGVSPVAVRSAVDVRLSRRAGLHVGGLRSLLGSYLAPGVRAADGVWAVDPLGGRSGDRLRPSVAFESGEAALSARLGASTLLDVSGWGARDRLRLDGVGRLRADTARTTNTSWAASARLRGLVGQRTFATAVVYHTRLDARTEWAGALEETDETLRETAASLAVEHALGLRHTLSVGAHAAARQVGGRFGSAPAGGTVEDRERAGELDVYVADTWSPAVAWQVQAGLRAEATRAAGRPRVLVSPRLFARWTVTPDRLVLRAGLSRQTQSVQRLVRRAGPLPLASARWATAGPGTPPASAWQGGAGAEWAPTERLALSADLYGRLSGDVLGADETVEVPDEAERFSGFVGQRGRAAGLELAARLSSRAWTVSFAGATALADVRSPGRAWRAAPYSRPLAAGLAVERGVGPLGLGLRLDAASGLPGEDGREPADVRAGVALGLTAKPHGLRIDALAQAQVRLAGAWGGAAVDPTAVLPLAVDARALPAVPTLSLAVRW